jgi:hypothetical protein
LTWRTASIIAPQAAIPRPKTHVRGGAAVDARVATLGDVARGHAIEELVVGDLARLEQVEVVDAGRQVVDVLELVHEEAEEIKLDGVLDRLPVAADRLGHDAAEIEDGAPE